MDEMFFRSIDTLQKARETMSSQLRRHSSAPAPDRVRLPRLQQEAAQMQGVAAALLDRIRLSGAGDGLVAQAHALATFFEQATIQAAHLVRQAGSTPTQEAAEDENENYSADVGEISRPRRFEAPRNHRAKRLALLTKAIPLIDAPRGRPVGLRAS